MSENTAAASAPVKKTGKAAAAAIAKRRGKATATSAGAAQKAGKAKRGKATTVAQETAEDPMARPLIPGVAIRKLFVTSKQMHRSFPTITDAQLREYFFPQHPIQKESNQMYNDLTSKGTSLKAFANIMAINDTVRDLRTHKYSEDEEMSILSDLRKHLEGPAKAK
jgi:hypothetical protein